MAAIVLDLLADAAPTHVAHFITRAREGAYDGTAFHRVIAMGIIQGGDPLSKNPALKEKYGTGGLRAPQVAPNGEKRARVVEGIIVAQKISMLPADAKAVPTERVEVKRVTIRPRPDPAPEPFSTE